jgi:dipeptidase E
MELLLLSNSSSDAGYLVHAQAAIRELAGGRKTACFIPFAGVTRDWDVYEMLVRDALAPVGIAVQSLHHLAEPAAALRAIEAAELIVVGGGNTFRLLQCLRERGLLAAIAAQVRSGAARYIGWSAGANLACPTICTTNDMPVADPGGPGRAGAHPVPDQPALLQPRRAGLSRRNARPAPGRVHGAAARHAGAGPARGQLGAGLGPSP